MLDPEFVRKMRVIGRLSNTTRFLIPFVELYCQIDITNV